jgi:flagella basal body P-ring formation protein FlgA
MVNDDVAGYRVASASLATDETRMKHGLGRRNSSAGIIIHTFYPCSIRVSSVAKVAALALAALSTSAAQSASAAELKLRHECRCTHALVHLGDVAEIHAADPEQAKTLAAIELFPAPGEGQQRFVRAREIQDILALRGLNLSQHRLSGASRLEIRGAEAPSLAVPSARPLSALAVVRASERVQTAVVAHLQKNASPTEPWKVEVKLDADQARIVGSTKEPLTVQGGEAPWKGRQQLTILVPAEKGSTPLSVEALIGLAPMVAVATRSLVPGDNVQATDVKLVQASAKQTDNPFYRLEDLVGRQAIGAIVEGQVIDQEDVRAPLLVRRGDAVTVFSRSAGVQVRTTARAQEDGSRGDLITVESILNRQRFFARVTAIHEVEVFAHAVEARSAAGDPTRETRVSPPRPGDPGAAQRNAQIEVRKNEREVVRAYR